MPRALPALLLAILTACTTSGPVRIAADPTKVATEDGSHVWSWLLHRSDEPHIPPEARAVVFYVGGSGYERSVLSVRGAMAGFVAMGMPVVLLERRGIEPDGSGDPGLARRHADRTTRVADALAAMRTHLAQIAPGTPVLVVGESEGGGVAAAMAQAEPRITHLVLLGAGGGITQAEELLLLARQAPSAGYGTEEQLEAAFAAIRAHPEAEREWLGHPYRRWSSFLWSSALDDLLATEARVFVAHGDRDTSVPVESARILRDEYAARGRGHLLRYHEYAGLDHRFRDEQGRTRLDLVERDLLQWLRDQRLLD